MRRGYIVLTLIITMSLFVLQGCIKNDLDYPLRVGKILDIEFSGQIGKAEINNSDWSVKVLIADSVDMRKVKLLRFETNDSVTVAPTIASYLDLTSPVEYELTTYPKQKYKWTIIGEQSVDRYVKAVNQIGDALFNIDEFNAIFYVAENQPLDCIYITDIKLAPAGAKMEPDPLQIHDFREARKVEVTYRGISEIWTLKAVQKHISVETGDADSWACFAYLNGLYSPDLGEPSFQYKKKEESDWKNISSSELYIDGISVSTLVKNLIPSTEYVYRVKAGETAGDEKSFITEADAQMINMNFDSWIQEGKSWYPDLDLDENYWWDSGNKGANMISAANPTSPENSFVAVSGEGKRAARLETVSVMGIMAGGNIFSGQYLKTVGLGAQVAFGRPFASRPLQLKGYYSYAPKPVDKVKEKFDYLSGKNDRCHIFVYVTDWDEPFIVDTGNDIYLDLNDPHVIGFGDLIDSVGTEGSYKEFTIDIEYRNRRKPKYCAVVAVASQYADYFTGGIGSVMFVDEFSFNYEGDVKWKTKMQNYKE